MTSFARRAYFDCYSGAAGDMLLGTLLDAGLPLGELVEALQSLPLEGYRLRAERVTRHSITGTKLHVELDAIEQHQRHFSDIESLLRNSELPLQVIAQATAVFRRLAEAEAAVHGISMEQVHFHEVGAVDSIVDVVGCVWGLHALGVTEVFASPLPLGAGWVDTAHGRLPVPAPTTLRLLAAVSAPTRPLDVQVEMVTPTAAALLAELATFAQPPLLLESVGYGFGSRELPWPNAVRVWLGRAPAASSMSSGVEQDTVALLECNLDDITGETLGYVMERLLAAGALDVWFTPIQMKKNRPAVKLAVLAQLEDMPHLSQLLLRETTTLGVRQMIVGRVKAEREHISVETPWGTVAVKVKRLAGQPVAASPEYEDCAKLARKTGEPLLRIYAAAQAAAMAVLQAGSKCSNSS